MIPYTEQGKRRGKKIGVSAVMRTTRLQEAELITSKRASFFVETAYFSTNSIRLGLYPTYRTRRPKKCIYQSLDIVDVSVVSNEDGVVVIDISMGDTKSIHLEIPAQGIADAPTIAKMREYLVLAWREENALDLDWAEDEPNYAELLHWLSKRVLSGAGKP